MKKFGIIFSLFLLAGAVAYITYRSLNYRNIKNQIYTETVPRVNNLIDSASIEGLNGGEKCWNAFILISEAIKEIPGDTNLLLLQKEADKNCFNLF